MGAKQDEFLKLLDGAFGEVLAGWARGGGQGRENCARFRDSDEFARCRRAANAHPREAFELGDLFFESGGTRVVVEYDDGCISLSNLLKYWPYLRGDLTREPPEHLVLCHFSSWKSYGVYRYLWRWTVNSITNDSALKCLFTAEQFDIDARESSDAAIEFVRRSCRRSARRPSPQEREAAQ